MSIANRLALVMFAVVAGAVAIVYLYVVPQLDSRLTAERLRGLELTAAEEARRIAGPLAEDLDREAVERLVGRVSERSDARLTLIGVRGEGADAEASFVIADSDSDESAARAAWPSARAALRSRRTVSAITAGPDGERVGESAVPAAGRPEWVAVFSVSLAEVEGSVALIQRQILVAGLIGLLVAVGVGTAATRPVARRLRRLRDAASGVADGDFATPIPVDSRDELGELAEAFNEMQRRLFRLDSARREFIANASHELRTPIFSLGGFVELLEDEDLDPATRSTFIARMRSQIDRLTRLAGELLDLSRLDADALDLVEGTVRLDEVARTLEGELGPIASRRDARIVVDGGPAEAVGDPGRVLQVGRILLDNALGHTPEGTRITVQTRTTDVAAELVVSDDGPGIGREAAPRVFDRFYSGSSPGGSGLGLAIARELAKRMGGTVELRSRRSPTTFVLSLRRPPAPS